MVELDEQDKKIKSKRLIYWALFLISIGALASFTLPEHSLPYFIDLLRDIITNLIVI
jgi:hypothetical protein